MLSKLAKHVEKRKASYTKPAYTGPETLLHRDRGLLDVKLRHTNERNAIGAHAFKKKPLVRPHGLEFMPYFDAA